MIEWDKLPAKVQEAINKELLSNMRIEDHDVWQISETEYGVRFEMSFNKKYKQSSYSITVTLD